MLKDITKQIKPHYKKAAGNIAGSLFIICLLTACATAPLQLAGNKQLSPDAQIDDVPFFPQQQYQCGPAALAMVLNYAGISVTSEQLVKQVYLPDRKGSLQIEMLAGTRHYERIPYVITPTLETLLQEIEAGNPVLVLQNLGLNWAPAWHYAVAIGYDLQQQLIILHSGVDRSRPVPLKTFARTWRRADNWGMVVTSPEQIPVSAEPQSYLATIAALPDSSTRHQAYVAAARRWPEHLLTQIGLGNSYYEQYDLPAAEQAYRTAVEYHPLSTLALNNLAQTLADQNKLEEAMNIVQQALNISGPYSNEIQNTREEIRKKQASH